MEAATKERELSGEKAQRIIDAMRESVAKRGAAGSTFEHVAREAGVSRGVLHYYFGTKERLVGGGGGRGARTPGPRPPSLGPRGGVLGGAGAPPPGAPPPPPRRAAGQGRDGRRSDRGPARQPHGPDRERTGLLLPALRALQRRPSQSRDPAR